MDFPVLITKESSDSGISGNVLHISSPLSRIYGSNTLFYVLRGTLSCEYEEARYTLDEDDILFICEGNPIKMTGNDAYVLAFSIPGVYLLNQQSLIYCCSAGQADQSVFSNLRALISNIISTQYYGGPYFELKLSSLWREAAYELLTTFRRTDHTDRLSQSNSDAAAQNDQNDYFKEILHILDQNYDKNIKLNELADLYYYTPSHLSKLFVRYTGLHFSEYITELRLKKAMPLLTNTRLEMEEIAERSGFSSSRAFQQAFQKKYRIRPSKYRADFWESAGTDVNINMRNDLMEIREMGILDNLLESPAPIKYESSSRTVYIGSFDCTQTIPTEISSKNNILNVYRARDLLINEVQEEIRIMQKEIGYTYLNCHYFIGDDMQLAIPTHIVRRDNEHYDFSLQESALQFAKSQNLRMILQLGNVPSMLASGPRPDEPAEYGAIFLPSHMNEWEEYLRQLITSLHRNFGDWLLSCPVLLWVTPDIHIYHHKSLDQDAFFELYRCTYQAIKSVIPQMQVGSPTISMIQSGKMFEKDFLEYCASHDCMPDILFYTLITSEPREHPFFQTPFSHLECRDSILKTRSLLRSLKADPATPLFLMEYSYVLGPSEVNDSVINAMIPFRVLLQNYAYFDSFGYWNTSDFTTEIIYGPSQFSGGRSIFTIKGGKKPIFYSMKYISLLGSECVGIGDGYVITRKGDGLCILLYYDIPSEEWGENFTFENAFRFYQAFPDRHISLDLGPAPDDELVIREEYLNYENGCALETWLASGGPLLESRNLDSGHADSVPAVRSHLQSADSGILHYQCSLKPFELRLVDIIHFYRD